MAYALPDDQEVRFPPTVLIFIAASCCMTLVPSAIVVLELESSIDLRFMQS